MTLPCLSEDVGNYFPIFLSYSLRFFLGTIEVDNTSRETVLKSFLNINAKFVNAGRIRTRYAENRDREKVKASRIGKWFLLAGNADPLGEDIS